MWFSSTDNEALVTVAAGSCGCPASCVDFIVFGIGSDKREQGMDVFLAVCGGDGLGGRGTETRTEFRMVL